MNQYIIVPKRKARGENLKQNVFGEAVVKVVKPPQAVKSYTHEEILKELEKPEWNITLSKFDKFMLWVRDILLP